MKRFLLLLLLSALSALASLELKPASASGAPAQGTSLAKGAPASSATSAEPAPGNGKWQGGNFPDTSFEGVRYISTVFLESLFGREGSWVPDRQKFVIADSSGKKWFFTLDNPYMNIGDEVFNLGFPVRRGPEFLYLPLPSLLRILNAKGFAIAPPPVSSSAPSNSDAHIAGTEKEAGHPEAIPGGYNMLDMSSEERDNGTLVCVKTSGKLKVESFWVPPHFILKFESGLLAPKFPAKIQGEGLVKNVQALQEKDLVQLTLNIPKPIDTVEVAYADESSPQFLVTVRKQTAKKAKEAAKEAQAAKDAEKSDRPKSASKSGGTIIIDPGHGGHDQGAQVSGVNEAQITLAVAEELKAELTRLGYKALMTRENDSFVSLPDRPKFASSQGGDLFISLHCNSISGSQKHKKGVTGFTAYILREGESEEDKALARRENEAVSEESGKNNKGEISPVEWILLEHQLNLYSKESEGFAEQIVKEFDGFQIAKYSTGASQAGFYVLVGAYMPAALFEMGFLTNDRDRQILGSDKGRKQIAERLAKAISKFRQAQLVGAIQGDGKGDGKEGKGKMPK